MFDQAFHGVVQRLDRDNDQMSTAVEVSEIVANIVTWLIDSTCVEERQERRFSRGKLVFAREASAGPKTTANLRIIGACQIANKGGFAALRFAKQPEYGHRRFFVKAGQ